MEFSKFSNALNAPSNDEDIEEDIDCKFEDNQDVEENNEVFAQSISNYNKI